MKSRANDFMTRATLRKWSSSVSQGAQRSRVLAYHHRQRWRFGLADLTAQERTSLEALAMKGSTLPQTHATTVLRPQPFIAAMHRPRQRPPSALARECLAGVRRTGRNRPSLYFCVAGRGWNDMTSRGHWKPSEDGSTEQTGETAFTDGRRPVSNNALEPH